MRRCGDPARFAIPQLQNLGNPSHAPFAKTDSNQRSGNIAHHVLQERIRRDIEGDPVALAIHSDMLDLTNGRGRLAARRPECREIMSTEQVSGRLVHPVGVERLIHPPGAIAIQRRTLQPIQYAVAVAASGGREARVKRIVDGLHPGHADIVGETAVCSQEPAASTALTLGIEVDDLTRGMNAGVGAAGAYDLNRPVGNGFKRLLQALLNAETGLLTLPAVVIGPVVFDAERDSNSSA